MSEQTMVRPGDRFRVTSTQDVKNDRGRLLARYHVKHPETDELLDYAVTERNVGIVNKMIAEGTAVQGGAAEERRANRLASNLARVKGKVNTSKPKKGQK